MAEIIKKEKLGIVTVDFANAILEIYNNREKFIEMAEWGQDWMKGNLSWEKFCEKMLKAFYEYKGV